MELAKVRNAGGMYNRETGWLSIKKVKMDLIIPGNYDVSKLKYLEAAADFNKLELNIIKF